MGGYSSIPYNPEAATDAFAKGVSLASLLQQQKMGQLELQQKQQDMADQQKLRQIFSQAQNWDDALNQAQRAGVSPRILIPLAQQRTEQRNKLLEGDEKQQKLDAAHADWAIGQVEHLKALPLDQRQAALPAIRDLHAKMFPKYADQFPQQLPTDDASLQMFGNLFRMHSTDLADVKVEAERTAANARMKAAGKQPEGEMVLGDRVSQLNDVLTRRYQVLNPGQSLPQSFTLPENATQKDFDRIDRLMEATERARGTKAQQDTANAMRQQASELAQQGRQDNRAQRSYEFHAKALDKLGEPVDAAVGRLGRLQDTINQGTPQADALVAPELLTVMAGGQGSGLRMNEAEIQRIVGGRSNWESLQAAISKWQGDPSKANSITPAQRQQIRSLMNEVQKKLLAKQSIMDDARQQLVNSNDPQEHAQIYAETRRKMSAIDQGAAPNGSRAAAGPARGYVRIQASDGSVHDIPQANLNKAKQRDPNLKVMQ